MRLFQNAGIYPSYRRHFDRRHGTAQGFIDRRRRFLADRFGAAHLLLPVQQGDTEAFFTNGDDDVLQRAWARENGLAEQEDLAEILLSQVEAHRTEVFYNLDPMRYGSDFVRRLPGCVRHTLAWRAAPSPGADFAAYGRILCNFPAILESYRARGWAGDYFAPAHDTVMDEFAANRERPVDVLFVGGYSRHHLRRAQILEAVAKMAPARTIRYHLDKSRLTRLAETPIGLLGPLAQYRRSREIRRISEGPIFGLDLYRAMSRAKVILNCAVDMAGMDRGNMRCFEAMGCSGLLVSDSGRYPAGMETGENMITYSGPDDVVAAIRRALDDPGHTAQLASNGHAMVRSRYSSDVQWRDFRRIVEAM